MKMALNNRKTKERHTVRPKLHDSDLLQIC